MGCSFFGPLGIGHTYNACDLLLVNIVKVCVHVYVVAPASDQAFERGLRRRQQQQQQANRKTPKHVDNGRHDDRIQARTADVTASASGPGRPDLVLLLSCVAMATARATLNVGYLRTTRT